MTRQPRPMILGALQPGKPPSLVYPDGVPVAVEQRITTTAGDLAQSLALHVADAYLAGREAGIKAGLKVGVTAGAQVGIDRGYDVGVKAGAEAGVKAGARYGAEAVVNNSRVRRTVERDSEGRITGSIEDRVFEQPTPPPAAGKVIGFRPPATKGKP